MPGYFGDKYPVGGKVLLNEDPNSIRLPMERPAFFKREPKPLTEDDLVGLYTLEEDDKGNLIEGEVTGTAPAQGA